MLNRKENKFKYMNKNKHFIWKGKMAMCLLMFLCYFHIFIRIVTMMF